MKRIVTFVAVLLVVVMLLPPSVMAQSKEDGERLWREADNLRENAKSRSDLEAAIDNYNEAFGIFEKLGHRDRVR